MIIIGQSPNIRINMVAEDNHLYFAYKSPLGRVVSNEWNKLKWLTAMALSVFLDLQAFLVSIIVSIHFRQLWMLSFMIYDVPVTDSCTNFFILTLTGVVVYLVFILFFWVSFLSRFALVWFFFFFLSVFLSLSWISILIALQPVFRSHSQRSHLFLQVI